MRAQSVTRYSAFARVGLALRRHQSTSWTRRRRVWVESGRSRRVIFTARARCVFRGAFLACSPSSLVVMRPVAQEGGICVWGLRPKFNSTFTVVVATAAIATATIAAALAAAALTVAVAAAVAAFPAAGAGEQRRPLFTRRHRRVPEAAAVRPPHAPPPVWVLGRWPDRDCDRRRARDRRRDRRDRRERVRVRRSACAYRSYRTVARRYLVRRAAGATRTAPRRVWLSCNGSLASNVYKRGIKHYIFHALPIQLVYRRAAQGRGLLPNRDCVPRCGALSPYPGLCLPASDPASSQKQCSPQR